MLARVLKGGLTDPSQIPLREWVALDAERRRAIETRLDHNAAGTEPAPNPELANELATEMTQAPSDFVHRDLVPAIAHLPLPNWQRFRDWQAGLRRNDPTTEDELYAIKRGLQLARNTLPVDTPDDVATNYRAELVDEVDAWRRVTGKSPDDAAIADMLRRVPTQPYIARSLESDPRFEPEYRQLAGDDTTTYGRALALWRTMITILGRTQGREAMRQAMRSLPTMGDADQIDDLAKAVEIVPVNKFPARINPNGQTVYHDPLRNRYVVRNLHGNGFWVVFDEDGNLLGTYPLGDLDNPVPRSALPDDLKDIWQNPPFIPPVLPPPILPGQPTDRPQVPDIETIPHEPAKPQIFPGQPIDRQSKPSITITPIPEIAPPPIYQSDDNSGREKMVAKPKLSGKERADDIPSFAEGKPRYVDQTPDDYSEMIMKNHYGENWRDTNRSRREAEYRKIKKFGTRNFMPPKSK
ncbi:MAG: hypothetical protein JO055_07610 [Alphaproteobacteria bacterium]|nr:hypothetical protein [Alphaproteobacteria bacterium]